MAPGDLASSHANWVIQPYPKPHDASVRIAHILLSKRPMPDIALPISRCQSILDFLTASTGSARFRQLGT